MSGRLGHGCLTSVLLVLLAVGLGGPVSGHERGRTAGDPSSCEQDTPIPLRLDQAYRRDLLPEGVLDPEDAASGFIYFKPSRPPESIYVRVTRSLAADGLPIVAPARVQSITALSS